MAVMQRPQASADDDSALWARFRAGSLESRHALVMRYERLVRILAAKAFSNRVSQELEFNDYYQFGMVGLLQSVDRYDATKGAGFETFATRRVAGAILDGVETLSEKQNQVVTRQRTLKERAASMAEGAKVKPDVFQKLADVAIGLALGFMLEDTGLYLEGQPAYPDNSYSGVELRQLRKRVQAVVSELPQQERMVITLHYLQHQAFDEIALECGLSKGRISQIHHSALKRLRIKLNPDPTVRSDDS